MKIKNILLVFPSLAFSFSVWSQNLAVSQADLSLTDVGHPGSEIYDFNHSEKKYKCSKRDVFVYLPQPLKEDTPVVVFGHGQALNESHYLETYVHLARKGIAVIHPEFSSGFFDTNWKRMARDYVNLVNCVTDQVAQLDLNAIVFSGHSKGAYVAGIAGGLAFQENLSPKPASLVLLNSAGLDQSILSNLDPYVEITVVYSDKDKTVDRNISEDLYQFAPSLKKQFIEVISYPKSSGLVLKADHFWPLTKPTWLGGATKNLLHNYGSWKWLTSAALDAKDGASGTNPFLYGPLTTGKGVSGFEDKLIRNF